VRDELHRTFCAPLMKQGYEVASDKVPTLTVRVRRRLVGNAGNGRQCLPNLAELLNSAEDRLDNANSLRGVPHGGRCVLGRHSAERVLPTRRCPSCGVSGSGLWRGVVLLRD
jgi:hypothetical protein